MGLGLKVCGFDKLLSNGYYLDGLVTVCGQINHLGM